MARLTEKRARELEKEAEEDFSEIVSRRLVNKWTAVKVLKRHEKTIRGYIADNDLIGHLEKDGYHIETVSMAAYRYKVMHRYSRKSRFKDVYERFSKYGLIFQ
jgi:predicted RNA-binding protein associated with RNAse of E/G family